jgi:hypothetical protein
MSFRPTVFRKSLCGLVLGCLLLAPLGCGGAVDNTHQSPPPSDRGRTQKTTSPQPPTPDPG